MKLAIQGHPTRGKEIIQILKNLGATSYGTNDTCSHPEWYWYINKNREVCCNNKKFMCGYKLYTLEEFEKEFPFKVGDKVIALADQKSHKIIALEYYNDKLCYVLDNGFHYQPHTLTTYEKMKEERNITLTLDKAKEWYKKGGELKEIALQAFTEMELNPLPKSWEEYCRKYGYACLSIRYTNLSLKYDALIKLEQLRDCWRQGWKPKPHESVYTIKFSSGGLRVYYFNSREFLSFPTKEMAEEFLECFRDLIEQAGDLI